MRRPDLVDRRQRVAAAALLCAIRLPAPMGEFAKAVLAAGRVCPGVKVEEIAFGDRVAALKRARGIIDELLAEAAATPPGADQPGRGAP